jgi:UrcA family protein
MLIKQNVKSNKTPSRVNILTAAVMTAGLVFSALPANAYIPRDNQISIRVNPVDLETEAGIQRVYDYMTNEAEAACETAGKTTLSGNKVEANCAADLLEDFVADLNDKRLIDFHKSQISA